MCLFVWELCVCFCLSRVCVCESCVYVRVCACVSVSLSCVCVSVRTVCMCVWVCVSVSHRIFKQSFLELVLNISSFIHLKKPVKTAKSLGKWSSKSKVLGYGASRFTSAAGNFVLLRRKKRKGDILHEMGRLAGTESKHGSACHLKAYDLGGDGEVLANFKHGCCRLRWIL